MANEKWSTWSSMGTLAGTEKLVGLDGGANEYTTPADLKTYIVGFGVNFNGTGTPAIISSQNVTSITDNATGDFTINLTSALASGLYRIASTAGRGASGSAKISVDLFIGAGGSYTNRVAPTTSAFRIRTTNSASTDTDPDDCHLVGFL